MSKIVAKVMIVYDPWKISGPVLAVAKMFRVLTMAMQRQALPPWFREAR